MFLDLQTRVRNFGYEMWRIGSGCQELHVQTGDYR